MINSKLIEIFQTLEIPIYWIEYNGEEMQYIIFQTINQDNINHFDDLAHSENIEISLIYWFNESVEADIVEENLNKIKVLLRENNFIKLEEKDLKDENYYGRSFLYSYVRDIEGL